MDVREGRIGNFLALGAITARRFVKATANRDQAAPCGADEAAMGVSKEAVVNGAEVEVVMSDEAIVEAGAAIAVNGLVRSNAAGKAIPATPGTHDVLGVAQSPSTGDGVNFIVKLR